MAEALGFRSGSVTAVEYLPKDACSLRDLREQFQDVTPEVRLILQTLEMLERSFPSIFEGGEEEASDTIISIRRQLHLLSTDLQRHTIETRAPRQPIQKTKIEISRDLLLGYQERLSRIYRAICLRLQAANLSEAVFKPPLQPTYSETLEWSKDRYEEIVHPIDWQPVSLLGRISYRLCAHPQLAGTQVIQARTQLPLWMSGISWDFEAYRNVSWNMTLRSWATRPIDSTLFQLVFKGQWPGILDYLQQHHISPMDRDENGSTLLHVYIALNHVLSNRC
ncbi:unnamed protein product [Colletotrichum noveboracense]|uniref:Uncharacterized protein n=1 Tax=Colletotrichum noveboracense TaxID=2664923 RepID=A0A9W4WBQ6_9PEZI|nr:unnamed protein product [Colletotrichum noveboracense]